MQGRIDERQTTHPSFGPRRDVEAQAAAPPQASAAVVEQVSGCDEPVGDGDVITDARKVLDAAMPEIDFMAQIIECAEACGWWVFHVHDSRRSNPGWPDLVLLRGVVMILLEIKAKKGRRRPEQIAVIARLKQVKYVFADFAEPSNWPEIEAVLKSPTR